MKETTRLLARKGHTHLHVPLVACSSVPFPVPLCPPATPCNFGQLVSPPVPQFPLLQNGKTPPPCPAYFSGVLLQGSRESQREWGWPVSCEQKAAAAAQVSYRRRLRPGSFVTSEKAPGDRKPTWAHALCINFLELS